MCISERWNLIASDSATAAGAGWGGRDKARVRVEVQHEFVDRGCAAAMADIRRCLLCPRKRTLPSVARMSAKCQERTCTLARSKANCIRSTRAQRPHPRCRVNPEPGPSRRSRMLHRQYVHQDRSAVPRGAPPLAVRFETATSCGSPYRPVPPVHCTTARNR